MSQKLVRRIWQGLPQSIRLVIIRITQPTFTVSTAAVITNSEGKVLLLEHVLRPRSGWGLPGGFLDRAEQPEAAIRRELREETGIKLENLCMFRIRTLGRHVEILFSAGAVGEPEVLSREILQFGWFRADELPDRLPQGQKRIIEAVISRDI